MESYNLKIKFDNEHNYFLNKTLAKYLNKIKEQIDKHSEDWDNIKKHTNPYEYIHTCYPNSKHPISKLKPLSRAFFKFVEIANIFDIFSQYSRSIQSFHLAEGPGGFIEAIQSMRMNNDDTYYGMTLLDNTNANIPGWRKSEIFLEKHPNVIIETGEDGTGNLYNPVNFNYCMQQYGNKMDIITGDGGFDFSIDFNQQEVLATKLLFAQVSFAIAMQKQNGHFVLKIFDIFTKATIDIIYWLSTLYKQVYIIKPCTSRLANSEKYIICKYFKGDKHNIINNIISEYSKLNSISHISSILMFDLDYYYINKVEEYNAIFGQQQIENISSTITMFSCKNKNEKIELLKKNFIQKCVQWCEKHNISYNNILTNHNIFLNTP